MKKVNETELNKIKNYTEEYEFATKLIKGTIDNSISFHYENLKNNKIFWSKKNRKTSL